MDSNHELDKIFNARNLLILKSLLKSRKASKAGRRYLVNRSFELCPQLRGCRPFPRSESSIKGIRILVAEQVRHLCDIDIRPVEILARQFLARLQKQLTKSRPVVVDPPLQGPIA